MALQLIAEKLGKKFDGKWVFRNLSITLQKHDALAVLGSNGSGKTTLVKLLAGLLSPNEGASVLQIDSAALQEYHRFVGLTTPELALYPELTANEHIDFFSKLSGKVSRAYSQVLLNQSGLQERADEPTSRYSTGMKQRLKLILAVMHQPKLLLLDEPGSGLDEKGKRFLDLIIKEQKNEGILIIATNDNQESEYCNCRLRLDKESDGNSW